MLCSILSTGSTDRDGIHLLFQHLRWLKAGVCKFKTSYMRSCLKTNKNREEVVISHLPFLCCDHTPRPGAEKTVLEPRLCSRHPGGLGSWEVVNTVGRGSTARSDGHSCLADCLCSRDKCRHREAFHAEPMGLGPASGSLCLLKKQWHPACHCELPLGSWHPSRRGFSHQASRRSRNPRVVLSAAGCHGMPGSWEPCHFPNSFSQALVRERRVQGF